MRRRRRKNSGARWLIALVVVGALAWFGREYWMGYLPSHAPAPVAQTADLQVPDAVTEAGAVAAASTVAAPAPTPTATFMTEAEARDAAARAAREQTLKVQKGLRDAQQAHQDQLDAAKADKNTRCIGGQKMKRVDNGWVQAGAC
jgi:hypothetical protein